jgi:hypothetical protein
MSLTRPNNCKSCSSRRDKLLLVNVESVSADIKNAWHACRDRLVLFLDGAAFFDSIGDAKAGT